MADNFQNQQRKIEKAIKSLKENIDNILADLKHSDKIIKENKLRNLKNAIAQEVMSNQLGRNINSLNEDAFVYIKHRMTSEQEAKLIKIANDCRDEIIAIANS